MLAPRPVKMLEEWLAKLQEVMLVQLLGKRLVKPLQKGKNGPKIKFNKLWMLQSKREDKVENNLVKMLGHFMGGKLASILDLKQQQKKPIRLRH